MKILHLSDIHFGISDDNNDQPRIADALVKALRRDNVAPDLCIFSGDLAQKGIAEEFAKGQQWLADLVAPWSTRLFIVPGNHDVYQPDGQHSLFRAIARENKIYGDWRKNPSWDHLRRFFEWHSAARSALPLRYDWDSRFGFHATETVGGVKVHIVGLNSSTLSCADDDRGNLVVDIRTLNDALAKVSSPDELVIAIAHHPTEALTEWNRNLVERLLGQDVGVHLFFHGDSHLRSGTSQATAAGASLTTFGAGAAYQSSQEKLDCSLYTLDFETRDVSVKTYLFSLTSGTWEDRIETRRMVSKIPLIRDLDRRRKATVRDSSTRGAAEPLSRPGPEAGKAPSETATPEQETTQERTGNAREELHAYRLRDVAREVQSRILLYFNEIEEVTRTSYAFKYRVKSVERILQKLADRKSSSSEYNLWEMPDVCGFRIITLYQDDIPVVLRAILTKIAHDDTDQAPFLRDRQIEIDTNTSRLDIDPLSLEHSVESIKSQIKSLSLKTEVKRRDTSYSSIHIVAWVRTKSDPAEMRIEIQLRTALEDVWGEIDHKLDFQSRRGDKGKPRNRHLGVLKNLIDSLISYIDVIKKSSAQPDEDTSLTSKIERSIVAPRDQIMRLQRLPAPILGRLKAAYDIWNEAVDARQKGQADATLFGKGAEAFKALLDEFRDDASLSKDLAAEFKKVCEAEYAFLLLHTGRQEDSSRSEAIYLNILKDNPNDVIANFRLGELERKRGKYEEAAADLRRALETLEKGGGRLNKRHFVYDMVRLGLGLTYWRIFGEKSLPQEEKTHALREALRLAKSVIENPAEANDEERMRAVNDFLYYFWEAKRDDAYKDLVANEDPRKLQGFRDELYRYCTRGQKINEYYWLDTILRFVGDDCEKARPIALSLESSLEDVAKRAGYSGTSQKGSRRWFAEILVHLTPDEQDCLILSQEILEKCGR